MSNSECAHEFVKPQEGTATCQLGQNQSRAAARTGSSTLQQICCPTCLLSTKYIKDWLAGTFLRLGRHSRITSFSPCPSFSPISSPVLVLGCPNVYYCPNIHLPCPRQALTPPLLPQLSPAQIKLVGNQKNKQNTQQTCPHHSSATELHSRLYSARLQPQMGPLGTPAMHRGNARGIFRSS